MRGQRREAQGREARVSRVVFVLLVPVVVGEVAIEVVRRHAKGLRRREVLAGLWRGRGGRQMRFQQPAEARSLHPDRPDVGLLEVFRLHVLVLIGSRSFPCHEHQRPKVSNVDLVTTSIVDRFID